MRWDKKQFKRNSDVYLEDDWKLGWEGNDIKKAVGEIIDMIIKSIR